MVSCSHQVGGKSWQKRRLCGVSHSHVVVLPRIFAGFGPRFGLPGVPSANILTDIIIIARYPIFHGLY